LPASVLVALHLAPDLTNPASLLSGHTRWTVKMPQNGERLSTGQVYIAPANRHLALERDVLRVFYGPRENGSRPAIDVLFRSAAVHHGARVIGVLLSGALSDGSVGLAAVRRCGGATLVQAPSDAVNGEMPRSALGMARVDHCVPAAQIPPLLSELIRRPAVESPPVPADLQLEADTALRAADPHQPVVEIGEHLPLSCPECDGPLSYLPRAEAPVYRCHVGHSYNTESMLAAHSLALERALWVAFRTLKERGVLLAKMAQEARTRGYSTTARGFENHLRELEQHAASVHRAIAAVGDRVPHGESSDGDV
jgi:two-component system chemotaxis response regulator CheB